MADGNVLEVQEADRLLDGLTEQQRAAVTTTAARLRILAGAGSGKTRVLTRRIAHGARAQRIEPNRTLTLTFTRKAAGELRARLRKLGLTDSVTAGTFHAQAFAQLRSRWADTGTKPPELLDRRGRVLFPLLPRDLSRTDKLAVMAEVDWARARRVTPESYGAAASRAGRSTVVGVDLVSETFAAYEERKRRQRLVDFDDLLELAIRDLSDPEYARAQHWRFRHLLVDEFQDVNPLQFDLLKAWLGPESTLCVVGDPNQAIYAWNGADAVYLDRFEEFFSPSETVELTTNFRSTPQILRAAAAVLETEPLEAHRPDGPFPGVQRCDDEHHEARAIARRVRDRHVPGARWSRQAVLVRTNAQTTLIADALRSADVPVAIRAGASLLDDPTAADRVRELAETTVPLTTALADLRLDAAEASDGDERHVLESLVALAVDHVSVHPEATSTDFATWVRATVSDDASLGDDAVEVVTFHASKGLEWPVVHLAGVEDGLVPIGRAIGEAALAEERRLFYVAVTRAEDELHASWCASRRFGERVRDRSPSPYLDALARAGAAEAAQQVGASRNVMRVRELRARLGVADDEDETPDLREDIRAWRSRTARAAGVPAYVVFPDRTLDVLVASRPATRDQLAEVPGLGPVKIERYGDELLEMLGD
ncbi:MAG: ATP-dependent DNA helicase UvrD2 [Actinomycetota bacterium]